MESVLVYYRIVEADERAQRGPEIDIPNCFVLEVPINQEILLIDIIRYMTKWTQIGANFTFRAECGDDVVVELTSPSSVIPVSYNKVQLILSEAAAPPIIPVGQTSEFLQTSRQLLYQNYRRIAPVVTSERKQRPKPATVRESVDKQQMLTTIASAIGAKSISRSSSNGSARPKKYSDDTNDQFSDESRNSAYGYSDCGDRDRDRDRQDQRYESRSSYDKPKNASARGQGKTDTINEVLSSAGEIGSSLADVAGGAAKATAEAAAAAAGSFFSFAAKSLQAASELGSISSGITAPIQVGKRKVSITRELAEGGFGKVYSVQDVDSGQYYAMKHMLCQSSEQEADANDELAALQRFSGQPHIIQLIDCSSASKRQSSSTGFSSFFGGSSTEPRSNILREVYILFPLYRSGTAWDQVERAMGNESLPWPFSERHILEIILGTAKALQVIHSAGYSHRDVKPHNILLDEATSALSGSEKGRLNPVVMDLGSVSKAKVDVKNRRDALALEELAASKTSAAFRAPELTQVPNPILIDERVDIFGLGCTMYCLAFGWSPFESATEGVKRLAILNGRYSFPNQYVTGKDGSREIKMRNCTFSQKFCDLISDMLQHDHTNRPFSHQVVRCCEDYLSH